MFVVRPLAVKDRVGAPLPPLHRRPIQRKLQKAIFAAAKVSKNDQNKGLKLETLRELGAAGNLNEATLFANGPCWTVKVRAPSGDRSLMTDRGGVRRFRRIETAVSLLRGVGIRRITIDVEAYDRRQLSMFEGPGLATSNH